MKTLINNAIVITVNSDRTVYEPGAVVVDNECIVDVGPADSVSRGCATPDRTIDATGKVLLPGFVSAHNHLGYAVFRGRAEDVGHAPTHRLYLPMSGIITPQERLDGLNGVLDRLTI